LSRLIALWGLLSAVPPGLAFTPWFTSHGVQVEIARLPDSPPWLRGTAELPAAMEKVAAVLMDFQRYKDLFAPAVRSAKVLEAGEGSARVHFVWAYPFPFKNRDAVVLYRSEKSEAGPFVLSWRTDPRPRPEDPKEGVRIERVNGETRVEPLGPSRCRVIYTYLGDLGGKFPAWAQEKAWKEEPVQYVRALRRRLKLPDPVD
jgi:hypothetical protein